MIRAVIFDYDGVIGDTEKWQYDGWNVILKPYGVSITKKDYITLYCGRQGEDIDKELIDKFSLNIPYGTLVKKKEALILEWFKNKKIPLRPYVLEVLAELKRMRMLIGVASSTTLEELNTKIGQLGIRFDAISSKEEVKHSKPDPDIYLLTAKKLGVLPNECVVFEDTEVGVLAAKRAGMKVIAVPTEWSAGQDFSMADFKVNNLREGLEIIRTELF